MKSFETPRSFNRLYILFWTFYDTIRHMSLPIITFSISSCLDKDVSTLFPISTASAALWFDLIRLSCVSIWILIASFWELGFLFYWKWLYSRIHILLTFDPPKSSRCSFSVLIFSIRKLYACWRKALRLWASDSKFAIFLRRIINFCGNNE